ncbi:hypothetical protein C6502_17805 [Candidatus Poribacteria bacterium]|nr:MAG: hypothetical protein C6502_17805 [Candidatus Poribacteria bacterium]
MNTQGEVKLSAFFAIAIVEHLILILVLAMAAYTKPVPKIEDTAITVDILANKPEPKRIEEEIPIAISPTRQPEMPTELPPIQSTHNVQRYLNPGGPSGGLPAQALARTASQDPNRLALGAAPVKGRNQTLLDDLEATNARVREKPRVDEEGDYSASARRGVRDTDRFKHRGERGHSLTKQVSTGSVTHTGQSNVTDGVGFEFEISGEVSGRGYRLGKPIQTQGKQGGGVQISFKVKPDGTVYDVRVKPGFLTTVGEVRLKEQAKRYVERIRFNTLPKTVPQIDQSGEIFINFTTQLSQ